MSRISTYIVLFLTLILVVYLAFLDALAKPVFEQLATEQYGAEVSIDRLSLKPFVGKATLYELQVADRRNAMRNLVQADRVYVDIDIIKLAENVVEVSDMQVDGLLAFAPRATPATILRPLVEEDSGIARIGLPDFELPDVDRLLDEQRDALVGEVEALEQTFEDTQAKWQRNLDSVPDEDDVKAWKDRIRGLKNVDKPLQALRAAQEVKAVYQEVNDELQRLQNLSQDFRGDMQMLREQVELAGKLPEKYTNRVVNSLGLSSEQIALLGQQVMRGDLDGLLQQVLAPLAFNASGEAATQEDAMPIFVRRAAVNGSLLPSAAGLSVNGELKDFAWPLENADQVATLLLEGSSLDGGNLSVNANVDHRGEPSDSVRIDIADLPLKNMNLAGTETLGVTLLQTLANVTGELTVKGGQLDGGFTNRFTSTQFDTVLREGAGRSAELLARVLQSSTEFMMQLGFSGTLTNPEVSLASDMDQIFQAALEGAIREGVTELTNELQMKMTDEVGPKIAGAREQFGALEALQGNLAEKLTELNTLAGQQ
ncbi:MAG: hypothetical protein QNI86_05595 [Halieaceae bacterium]|nr:hypothetical protein [Halieaceae bacterium]